MHLLVLRNMSYLFLSLYSILSYFWCNFAFVSGKVVNLLISHGRCCESCKRAPRRDAVMTPSNSFSSFVDSLSLFLTLNVGQRCRLRLHGQKRLFFILLRLLIVLFRYATMLPLNHGWWYGIGNWSLEKCMKWTIMTGLPQKPTSISRIRFYKHTRETFPAWIRIKILSCKSITKPREYKYDLINTASHLITVAEITRHGNGFSVLRYLNTHLLCQIAQGINVEEG